MRLRTATNSTWCTCSGDPRRTRPPGCGRWRGQTTIGFGEIELLKGEIERVISLFPDGGLIFCTSRFIQEHCTIEELVTVFDLVYELVHQHEPRAA
jgi:hypothetical protein